jgi:hypothetical protein
MPPTSPKPSAANSSTAAWTSSTSKDTLRSASRLAIAAGDPGSWSGLPSHHKNRALAASRLALAVELKSAGLTYEAIARQMGYANRGTVYRIVSEGLEGPHR